MNTLEILVLCCVIGTVISKLVPRSDTVVAYSLGAVLAFMAGFRNGGFDYEQYLVIINHVRSVADYEYDIRILAGKDPIFLFIIEFISGLTLDPRAIFVSVSIISVATKVIASAMLPGNRALFISLYAVFLSPGLEFAAIRAGLGVGFLMLGVSATARWKKAFLFLLALGSHVSVLVAIFARVAGHNRILTASLILIAPAIPALVARFAPENSRLTAYTDNTGTIMALALPLLSLIAMLLLITATLFRKSTFRNEHFIPFRTTLVSLVFSVVLALPMVTVSFRLMEVAWALMLINLIATSRLSLGLNGKVVFNFSWILWLICLTTSNLLRSVWGAIANQTLL